MNRPVTAEDLGIDARLSHDERCIKIEYLWFVAAEVAAQKKRDREAARRLKRLNGGSREHDHLPWIARQNRELEWRSRAEQHQLGQSLACQARRTNGKTVRHARLAKRN